VHRTIARFAVQKKKCTINSNTALLAKYPICYNSLNKIGVKFI